MVGRYIKNLDFNRCTRRPENSNKKSVLRAPYVYVKLYILGAHWYICLYFLIWKPRVSELIQFKMIYRPAIIHFSPVHCQFYLLLLRMDVNYSRFLAFGRQASVDWLISRPMLLECVSMVVHSTRNVGNWSLIKMENIIIVWESFNFARPSYRWRYSGNVNIRIKGTVFVSINERKFRNCIISKK